jgi:hypothetical protein
VFPAGLVWGPKIKNLVRKEKPIRTIEAKRVTSDPEPEQETPVSSNMISRPAIDDESDLLEIDARETSKTS